MRNIKLTIEYDGTNYCGWQRQPNGISIQEAIEESLKKILKEPLRITGAGRTDSGVHARGQVANFRTKTHLTARELLLAANSALPKSIVIKRAEEMAGDFNARRDAKNKLYRYTILNQATRSPLEERYSYQYRLPLDAGLMRKEAKTLLGRHDFKSFQASDRKKRPSVCRINSIFVKESGKRIHIDIAAKGFLYNMARNIAGTLIEIGRGKLKEGDMKRILNAKDRRLAGPTAPARGLCLMKVGF